MFGILVRIAYERDDPNKYPKRMFLEVLNNIIQCSCILSD